jgi:histidinol-phosphatase (PHP family)
MRITSDNHNHIIYEPLGRMVASALGRGLVNLAITEHISQMQEIRRSVQFRSMHSSGRVFQNLAEYSGEFSQTRLDDGRIGIKKGLEVDYIRDYDSVISGFVGFFSWDILLCSVHEMKSQDVEHSFTENNSTAIKNRWEDYINTEIDAVERSEIPFQVLTHPVRLAYGTKETEKLPDLMVELAAKCRDRDKAMELNGKDLRSYPELVRIVAEACAKTKCKVSFGSDSHHPNEVAGQLEAATRLALEFRLNVI